MLEWSTILWLIAGIFMLLALTVSLFNILQHVRHYTTPTQQKHIVRIWIMVPVYSIDSWLSLGFNNVAVYLDVIRDCYEAFVLYSFFSLLIAYLNGEDNLVAALDAKPPTPHPIPFCCLRFSPSPGRVFLLRCKQMILQFMVVKPILAIITFVLELAGVYKQGQFIPQGGYLWVTIIDNISITLSLYFLVLFYLALAEELKEFRPIAKYLCIKAIVFFSFWQGFLLSLIGALNGLPNDAKISGEPITATTLAFLIQDFLICIEMFFISLAFFYAFDWRVYLDPQAVPLLKISNIHQMKPMVRSAVDIFNVRDTAEETYQTFHPDSIAETVPFAAPLMDKAQEFRVRVNNSAQEFRQKLGSTIDKISGKNNTPSREGYAELQDDTKTSSAPSNDQTTDTQQSGEESRIVEVEPEVEPDPQNAENRNSHVRSVSGTEREAYQEL